MQLTKRQCEVADRLVAGMTIAAIADDLDLTESRVNQIIRALKDRFKVDTQAGIVAGYQRALQSGLTQSEGTDDPEDKAATGDESLVPEVLNAPHPVLYRLVAISLAALVLAATFLLLTEFSLLLNDAMGGSRPVVGVKNGTGADG